VGQVRGVMEASGLKERFRLGEWVVEPAPGRISGDGVSRALPRHQVRILQCLAAHHGELVARAELRTHAWPDREAGDDELAAAIRGLHEALGDSEDDPRYVVEVASRGYALIAHVEPLTEGCAQEAGEPVAPAVSRGRRSLGERVSHAGAELKRRQVFKVLGGYLVAMWLVLQVAETTFEPLHLPAWWMTALTILAVTGIPIVGVLAWSYEITPAGVVRDPGDRLHVMRPRMRRALARWLVAGVALMAVVTALAWWRSIQVEVQPALAVGKPPPQSIAVLPLVDMTPGGGSAYLGDGLSEELSTQLAQVPGLRVASRTSAFEFKGRSVDVRRIGEALGVSHVLEGSVRRDGDRLRVTVQLIDTGNGYHVWAANYDRPWADVLALEDEIARAITQALELVLTPDTERRLAAGNTTVDPQAYDRYLEGVAALRQSGDLSQIDEATALFREALARDPKLARAHAGLCEAGLRRYNRTKSPSDVATAESACRKALELDPMRDETEMALGRLYTASGRYEQAEAVFRGLVARRPGDADVYDGLGEALAQQGKKQEAEQAFRKGVEVEPAYWAAHSALGGFLFGAGRADQAIVEFRRTTQLVPESATAYSNLGAAYMLAVRLKEAAAAFERSLAIAPSRGAEANLGTLYYFLGDYGRAASHYKSAESASQDHAIVGMHADALWMLPGDRQQAIAEYRRAIDLARTALGVNPSDAVSWAQLAYYLGRVGEATASARAEARAEALGGDDMYVRYYVALAAADRGDRAAAQESVRRLQELGYDRKLLAVDPVLGAFLTGTPKHAG
jgi:TolB-like protein/Tfp pilus assembly protein PilF/DNA-binding winged helix-turn-helix (wHTH) protein